MVADAQYLEGQPEGQEGGVNWNVGLSRAEVEGALWRLGLDTWPERKHQLRVGQLQQKKAVSGTQLASKG